MARYGDENAPVTVIHETVGSLFGPARDNASAGRGGHGDEPSGYFYSEWLSEREPGEGASAFRSRIGRKLRSGVAPAGALEGYSETAKHLSERVRCAAQSAPSAKRRRVWNDSGDGDLDLDRYLAGADAHWVRSVRGARRRVIRLAVGTCISGGNEGAVFSRLAARVAAVAETLERSGHSVAVDALSVGWSECAGRWLAISTPIKTGQQRLDPSLLIASCSGTATRAYTFMRFGEWLASNGYAFEQWGRILCYAPQKSVATCTGADYYFGEAWTTSSGSWSQSGVWDEAFREILGDAYRPVPVPAPEPEWRAPIPAPRKRKPRRRS